MESEALAVYRIPEQVRTVMNAIQIDEETGEVAGLDDANSFIQSATGNIEKCAMWLENCSVLLEAMKTHKKEIEKRIRTEEKREEAVKTIIKNAMIACDIKKIKSPEIAIQLRQTPASVVVYDDSLIPKEFIREKVVTTPDKVAIKAAIEAGKDVQGCKLERSVSLSIK